MLEAQSGPVLFSLQLFHVSVAWVRLYQTVWTKHLIRVRRSTRGSTEPDFDPVGLFSLTEWKCPHNDMNQPVGESMRPNKNSKWGAGWWSISCRRRGPIHYCCCWFKLLTSFIWSSRYGLIRTKQGNQAESSGALQNISSGSIRTPQDGNLHESPVEPDTHTHTHLCWSVPPGWHFFVLA